MGGNKLVLARRKGDLGLIVKVSPRLFAHDSLHSVLDSYYHYLSEPLGVEVRYGGGQV